MLRFVLLLIALVAAGFFIALHGVRAIGILIVIALGVTLPRTRVWGAVDRVLVRLTGSRRRAAALVLGVVVVVALAINLVPLLVH